MIWQSLKAALLSEAVLEPSLAAEDMALYAYNNRLMSTAEKITSKKSGDTTANSTSAWLRCDRNDLF
jgi:hypothetical protein